MIALGAWGRKFLPVAPEYAIRNQILEEGGHEMEGAFMDELRERNLGIPTPRQGPSVAHQLQVAFEKFSMRESER